MQTKSKYLSGTRGMLTAIGLFAALVVPSRLAAQPHYRVTDLGTLGGTLSSASGINNRGHVEGVSTLAGGQIRAFLWRNGALLDLGTLGGPNSSASWSPNERDEVGGESDTATPDPNGEDFCGFGTHLICLAFRWQAGVMTALPTLGGNNAFANEVNNRGQIVGFSEIATPNPNCTAPQVLGIEPVIWDKGHVHQLPTFPGDSSGGALVINDRGQAAGFSSNCSFAPGTATHVLLWENGLATDLGNLGGALNNFPQDINNRAQVVGGSDLAGDTVQHAFLWQNGVMTDIGGTLAGYPDGFAVGINEEGQVVGGACDQPLLFGNCRAFFWQNGVTTDLNTLIPAASPLFLVYGASINSRGQIAGLAMQLSTGDLHAYLATPCYGEADCGSAAANAPPSGIIPTNLHGLLPRRTGVGGLGRMVARP